MNFLIKAGVRYAYRRAQEPSTWRGIVLAVGGSYAAAHPELIDIWLPVLLAVVGAIGAMCPDAVGSPSPRADALPSPAGGRGAGGEGDQENFPPPEPLGQAGTVDAADANAASRAATDRVFPRLIAEAQQTAAKPARTPANVRPIPPVQPAADPSPHNPWGDGRNG